MFGKKMNLQKYVAKMHNSSAGRSHFFLEERAVNPTLQDPGIIQKFICRDQQEQMKSKGSREEDRRCGEEEERRLVHDRQAFLKLWHFFYFSTENGQHILSECC
jgi:hypothetical protein